MKDRIINYLKKIHGKYVFRKITKAYNVVYDGVNEELFRVSLDQEIINQYKDKWNVFGKPVEIKTLLMCYNLSGIIDLNIIPRNLFTAIIEKKLNPHKELVFLELKNSYNKWFSNKGVFPYCYLHKIDGVYYDNSYNIIYDLNEIEFIYPLILKPSKDTSGGEGVKFINNITELKTNLLNGDFLVCQEMINQNEELAKINNSSINSLRVCLYKQEKGFVVLNTSIRFGVNGGLDNTSSGGIVCNINDNGFLNDYAVDDYANKSYRHPNSGIEFKTVQIPMFEELFSVSKSIANQIIPCSLVSLDMCLDDNNNWRCIETNLLGQTISFAQYAGKGFFGKYTDEVINKTLA